MDNRPLWKHQADAVRLADTHKDVALLMDMGVGKSRTAIEILRRKYAKVGRLRKTLILAPKIVCPNWKNEFKMYSKVLQKDIVVLLGTGKKRVKEFLTAVGEDLQGNKIIVTNYESMQMEDLFALLRAWGVEILVCDESQRLKNHQSKRARAVVTIADHTQHNFILTGSPILNSAMDIFMQFRVLDRGETFGKNFFGFRAKYFHDANAQWAGKQSYFPKWEERQDTYDVLQGMIKKKAIRVLKKDCLDLPPFVRQRIEVGLSPEQAKAYREMYHDYVTFLEDNKGQPRAVVAEMAVVKALRLQQIVSGFVNDENGNPIRFKQVPRLDALAELLEDVVVDGKKKVIIWAVFRENYKMISEVCDKLGIKYTHITGDTKDKEGSMKAFREDPDIGVCIANQGAGGVGINLVEAGYSIYYSKGFKLEDDLQSEARNYRGGSEIHESITRIDIVTPHTIDELTNDALANKLQVSEHILGWKEQMKL